MYTTVNLQQFREAFHSQKHSFSYEGLEILFNYLKNDEENMDEDLELNVAALRANYDELTTIELTNSHCIYLSNEDDKEAQKDTVRKYLQDNTAFIGETNSSFVYRLF